MKKLISCIALLAMITSMTACGNDDSSVSRAEKATSAVTETKAEETTEKATEAEKKAPEASEEVAIEKMKDLFEIDSILAGFVEKDESDSFKEGNYTYLKVTNTNRISSIDEFQQRIKKTCTGDLRDKFIESSKENFKEKDGVLYGLGGGRGSLYFDLDLGVKLSDVTDKSFTVTTNENSTLYGIGVFKFVLEDNEWLIESYDLRTNESSQEYEDNDETKSDMEIMEDEAIRAMEAFNSIYSSLGGSVEYDESNTFTEDGVTYALVSDSDSDYLVDAMKSETESFFCGTAKEQIISLIDSHFKENDGALYVATGARGTLKFLLDDGVEITDVTDTSFTATTVISSDMFGKGIAHFELIDNSWHIESYEFN